MLRSNQLRIDPIVTSFGTFTFFGHAALDGSLTLKARLDVDQGAASNQENLSTVNDEDAVFLEASVTGTWAKPVLVMPDFAEFRHAFDVWMEKPAADSSSPADPP